MKRRIGDSLRLRIRVVRSALVSSILTFWCLAATMAAAHEVLPSIADMTETDGRLVFEVEANLEGFVAGIDLSDVSDTNTAAGAERYDALHSLSPAELEAEFRAFWPGMARLITIEAGGTRLEPRLDGLVIPEVDDPELPRSSELVFSVALPENAETVRVGWNRAFGALVLRQMGVEDPYDAYLDNGALSDEVRLAGGNRAGPWETFVNYIPVGIDHIVPLGLDHILFVLGLFFLSTGLAPLLWQVSAFTLAHTITLALAALGYVRISPGIVEPLIAASIVYVAVENILSRGLSPWRPAVIFGFGLLHGLGFASVLSEFGLPQGTFVPALVGFNIGVEVGQLAVIAVAYLLVRLAIRIDQGDPDVPLATGYYLLGGGALLVLSYLSLTGSGVWGGRLMDEISVSVFIVPAALVMMLCLASVLLRDQIDAYRRIVAIPASAGIAVIGLWWFIERVFLQA